MDGDGRLHVFKKYWAPVALYAGFIFYLSSIPSPAPAGGADLSVLHVPLFFGMCYLVTRAMLAGSKKPAGRKILAAAVMVTAAYGVLDELHQLYVPGRSFSYYDMGLDLLGACLIVFKGWWEKLFERVNM